MKKFYQGKSPYGSKGNSRDSSMSRRQKTVQDGLPAGQLIDFSPLIDFIREQDLLNFDFFCQTFGLDDSNWESQKENIVKQLTNIKPKNQRLIVIQSMLAVKGIQIETSALGMRILGGKPIIIDHDVNFREQKNLVEQVKYLQKVLGIFYKEGGKFKNSNTGYDKKFQKYQSPLNENNPSQQKFYKTQSEIIRFILEKNQLPIDIEPKEIIQEIINQINEQGRQVYIQENGVFLSIQPLLFKPKQDIKIIGSLHLLRWQDNILLVNLQGQQISVLSELYQAEICYDFLAQVNWQIKLKKEFGDIQSQNVLEQQSLKSLEEYVNGNQSLSQNRKCMFKLLKLEQKQISVVQQQLIHQSNMQIERMQNDLQQKFLYEHQKNELKRIMEEFEISNEAKKQQQLQERLQYYGRTLENQMQIFLKETITLQRSMSKNLMTQYDLGKSMLKE